MELEPVTTHPDALGEGPVWHDGRLLWVDLPRGVLRSEGGDVLTLPPPVTAALPSTRGLVLVLRDRLVLAETGEVIAEVPLGGADRCNDAKTDPRGRIWVGTMGPGGALFRLDPNGPTRVLDGVRISNGLGWSPDGRRMYYIDTHTGRIDVLDYDAGTGEVTSRRPLAVVEEPGVPDGLTVDTEGGVWVAIAKGGRVHRYLPTGELDAVLPLGPSWATSCTFGGPDLGTLYVTTAARDEHPHAGLLHATRTPYRGLPVTTARLPVP